MMFYIMLPCYIIVLVVFEYTLFSITKPNGYLLLGVTIPKEEMQNQEVLQMVKKYKMKCKLSLALFTVLIIGSFFVREWPITCTMYMMVWVGFFVLCVQVLFNKAYDELYDYKRKKGWIIGGKSTISIEQKIDTLKKQFAYPRWHWLIVLIMTAIGSLYGLSEMQNSMIGYVLMACNLLVSFLFFIMDVVFSRVKTRAYSSNMEVNLALNHTFCYEMTKAMTWSAYGNVLCWIIAVAFLKPLESLSTILFVSILPVILFLSLFFYAQYKVNRERTQFEQAEEMDLVADEDYYWRGGNYRNPNDPKLWVEKRNGIGLTMNNAHPAAKILYFIITVIVVASIIPIFSYWPLDFPSLSIHEEENTLYVDATKYGREIRLSDVKEAEVLDSLPKMYKNSGMEDKGFYFGKFRVKDYGQSKVYVNEDYPPFVVLHTEDSIYFVNSETVEETYQLIQELKEQGKLN